MIKSIDRACSIQLEDSPHSQLGSPQPEVKLSCRRGRTDTQPAFNQYPKLWHSREAQAELRNGEALIGLCICPRDPTTMVGQITSSAQHLGRNGRGSDGP